jgi:hypothetical protein
MARKRARAMNKQWNEVAIQVGVLDITVWRFGDNAFPRAPKTYQYASLSRSSTARLERIFTGLKVSLFGDYGLALHNFENADAVQAE